MKKIKTKPVTVTNSEGLQEMVLAALQEDQRTLTIRATNYPEAFGVGECITVHAGGKRYRLSSRTPFDWAPLTAVQRRLIALQTCGCDLGTSLYSLNAFLAAVPVGSASRQRLLFD